MTTPPDDTAASWSELCGSLPAHDAEVMAAHQGQPSVAVQDRTHGARAAAADYGPDPGSVTG